VKLPVPVQRPRARLAWPLVALRVLLAAGVLWILFLVGPNLREEIHSLDARIAAAGSLAPLAFLAAGALLIPLFFPVTAFKVAAGALFGPVFGTAICVATQGLSAAIIYELGRGFFRERVQRLAGSDERLELLRDAAARGTATRQFLVRMSPLSFTLVSYVLAGLGVSRRTYLVGCLAAVPSTLVTVGFAHAARSAAALGEQPEGVERSWNLLIIGFSLAGLLLFGWLVQRVYAHLVESATR
jgi:uncharacterized membrane protein YdjX (TVP38/TMEM64 family)